MSDTTPVPFVDLGRQYESIRDEVHTAIDGVLERGDFILGKGVADFEQAFASKCGAAFGIAVDSGTSALELVLRAYGIGPGDEVITQANTFIATALAISHSGATPVLVDADPETYMIQPKLIRKAITPRTKAIMPVHLYGHPADMDAIMAIAAEHDLIVIEDASQAHTATYKGEPVGGFMDHVDGAASRLHVSAEAQRFVGLGPSGRRTPKSERGDGELLAGARQNACRTDLPPAAGQGQERIEH